MSDQLFTPNRTGSCRCLLLLRGTVSCGLVSVVFGGLGCPAVPDFGVFPVLMSGLIDSGCGIHD